MRKLVIFCLIVFCVFVSVGSVCANENVTKISDSDLKNVGISDTVECLDGGDSNISFSDDYKGYCIEWGEDSAEKGDKFIVDGNVDNNLKVFFVYFYKDAQKDVISTQHMIWKFSDGKEFSRFNKTLYDNIVCVSDKVSVSNDGTLKVSDTCEMVFSFRNFISPIDSHQNYFGYKVFFRNITNESSVIVNNSTVNNYTNYTNISMVNKTVVKEDRNVTVKEDIRKYKYILNGESTLVSKHSTGGDLKWVVLVILILSCFFIVRRYKGMKK